MAKQYISVERTLSPRPRSKRRRETGEGGSSGNITVVQNGGGSSSAPVSGDGHTHDNKSTLDKLGIDGEGYVTVTDWQENGDGDLEKTTSKSKAGYADKAGTAGKATVAQNLAEDSTDWQTIDDKIAAQNRANENKFLRKDQSDETPYNLGIGQDLTVGGDAIIGGKLTTDDLEADDAEVNNDLTVGGDATIGGKLTTDDLEADDAIVNNNLSVGNNLGVGGNASVLGKTTTHELDTGDAVFRNRASSLDFISGFVAGTGWGITKEQIENALGVVETKYHLEIDKLTVRGQMRVYEMIISQLLGENDNRVLTAMMEVDHYDAATGRVYFDNKGGRLYNPFRHDDYIKVQQYNPAASNGYVIKSYELLIDGIYSGYENGERVDWVTFRNFSPSTELPSEIIAAGDTFTRWDNKTDAERKGLISITTVGPQTPYIDIMHGAKTDPDNALKGRIGNLSGIRHHLFGWLDGFGEYLINLYAVGDFRLRNTGESLDAKIEALRGLMSTNYAQTVYDITEDGNYLKNATFASMDGNGNFRHWAISADNVVFYTLAGLPLYENTALMGNVARVARLVEMDGKKVLHIVNNTLTQANADIKKPGTHKVYQEPTTETTENYTTAKDKLYLSIKMKVVKSGRLTIGFPASESVEGSLPKVALDVEKSNDWQILEWDGTWDGTGDFVMGFTGEAYFSLLSLTDEPLDEFKKEYNTQIIQTAKNITLTASRVTATETSIAQLQVTADGIIASVTALRQDMEGADQQLSSRITQTATDITAAVSRISANESAIAQLQITADGISASVTALRQDMEGADQQLSSRITQTATDITAAVSRISANESAIAQLQITADGLSATVESNYTTLVNNISDINDDIDGLNGDIVSITTRVGSLEVTASNITARVSSVETTVVQHGTAIDGINDDIDGINNDLVSITTRVGELEVTDSNITARVSSVETTVRQHGTSITNINGDISDINDDIDGISGDIISITTRVGSLEVTANSITSRVTSVESTVSDQGDDISALQTGLGSANTDISSITTRVGNLETRADSITATVSSHTSSINGLTSDVSSLRITSTEMVSKVTKYVSGSNIMPGIGTGEDWTYQGGKYTSGSYEYEAGSLTFDSSTPGRYEFRLNARYYGNGDFGDAKLISPIVAVKSGTYYTLSFNLYMYGTNNADWSHYKTYNELAAQIRSYIEIYGATNSASLEALTSNYLIDLPGGSALYRHDRVSEFDDGLYLRYKITFRTVNSSSTYCNFLRMIFYNRQWQSDGSSYGYMRIANIQLEVGQDATVFNTPTAQAQSLIKQTADSLVLSASHIRLEGIVTANNGFKIDQDGSLTANAATFNLCTFKGTVRSPFVTNNSSYTIVLDGETYEQTSQEATYDNLINNSGYHNIPFGVEQSGRTLTIVHWEGNTGSVTYNADNGYYFYEDGVKKTSITISRELVVLKGYGTSSRFLGWIVVSRTDLYTTKAYGRYARVLAMGKVNFSWSDSAYSMGTYQCYDLSDIFVTRLSQGKVQVTIPTAWNVESGKLVAMVNACSDGGDSDDAGPVYAGISKYVETSGKVTGFVVNLGDDSSRNDSSFQFVLFNIGDWDLVTGVSARGS